MYQVPADHELESPFQGFAPPCVHPRSDAAEPRPAAAFESLDGQRARLPLSPPKSPPFQPAERELYTGPQPILFTERETDLGVESELCECQYCNHGRVTAREVETETPSTPLTATVGMTGVNRPDEVLRVQGRLVELGMSWVKPTGKLQKSNGDPTVQAIRLFQAMLRGTAIWTKELSTSACPQGVALVSGTIEPQGLDERWLWWADAPRWNVALPAARQDWGPANLRESGISSWLVSYLDELGPAFRRRLDALSPVLNAFVTGGVPALTRMLPPGPQQPGTPESLTLDLINSVQSDLVQFAASMRLNAQFVARQTLDEIVKGRAGNLGLSLNGVSSTQGGCAHHVGHQNGLEFDLRLFSHTGPQPGLGSPDTGAWLNQAYSRLLTGLAIQCILEHRYTKLVIYNDPVIWQRTAGRVRHDTKGVHNNHVHVEIAAGDQRPGPPIPSNGFPFSTRPEPEANEMQQEFDALQASEAPSWLPSEFLDHYDLIQSTVDALNARLACTPQYVKLDADWIRAMMAVETKPNTVARRFDPLSVAHYGDPALAGLQAAAEGSSRIDPELPHLLAGKKAAHVNSKLPKGDQWDYLGVPALARLDAALGIRGGIAWLAVKAQSNDSLEDSAEYTYVVGPGENLSSIAPKLQTTVAVLTKYNGDRTLPVGARIKYHRAQRGWKSWHDATVAYNGGGDPNYVDKVVAKYAEIKRNIPLSNTTTPTPEAPSPTDAFEV